MFQLDDKFLEETGLNALPDEQKGPFLQHVYDQLEYRVGVRLSEGMSDAQLEQFESIIDKDPLVIDDWIAQYAPAYQTDELYLKIQQAISAQASVSDAEVKSEYAATKWLEVNRPDYRAIVAQTLNELKQEISRDRDSILGTGPAAA